MNVDFKHIELDIKAQNYTATLWLNRQDKRNALNPEMIGEIHDALRRLKINDQVRVVVIRGKGPVFCAGADLQWMARQDLSQEESPEELLPRFYLSLFSFPKPLIAMVEGPAMGGAVGLVCCADFILATKNARFSFSEVKLGLIPATISPFVVRKLGEYPSLRLMLQGNTINGQEATQVGLADQLVTGENHLTDLCAILAENAPNAMQACKNLIRGIAGKFIDEELLHTTAEALKEVRSSKEAKEGLKAFNEKRKPIW